MKMTVDLRFLEEYLLYYLEDVDIVVFWMDCDTNILLTYLIA